MTLTQELKLITASIVVVASVTGVACSHTETTDNKAAVVGPQEVRGNQSILEDPPGQGDSPIIIGNGSVHVRTREGKFHKMDDTRVLIDIEGYNPTSVAGTVCAKSNTTATANASCGLYANSFSPLTAPWSIQLVSGGQLGTDGSWTGGTVVGTFGTAVTDSSGVFPGLLAFTASSSAYAISQESDNGGDGSGFAECVHGTCAAEISLNYAAVTTNGGHSVKHPTNLCPSPTANASNCVIKISYCDATHVSSGSCS